MGSPGADGRTCDMSTAGTKPSVKDNDTPVRIDDILDVLSGHLGTLGREATVKVLAIKACDHLKDSLQLEDHHLDRVGEHAAQQYRTKRFVPLNLLTPHLELVGHLI